jgi:hypothetical protein
MIDLSFRRAACGLLLCCLAATPVLPAGEPARSWNFRVYLDQDLIGYHDFTLTPQGDTRELKSAAQFAFKILFFTAYHYDHHATEYWRGDCLSRLDSSSDDDGKTLTVHRRYALTECPMTFAYWNPLMLRQTHLINPETGEDVPVAITSNGEQDIQVRNASVHAQRYHLRGPKLDIDLWYSTQGEWLALESATEKGRRVRYVLN